MYSSNYFKFTSLSSLLELSLITSRNASLTFWVIFSTVFRFEIWRKHFIELASYLFPYTLLSSISPFCYIRLPIISNNSTSVCDMTSTVATWSNLTGTYSFPWTWREFKLLLNYAALSWALYCSYHIDIPPVIHFIILLVQLKPSCLWVHNANLATQFISWGRSLLLPARGIAFYKY